MIRILILKNGKWKVVTKLQQQNEVRSAAVSKDGQRIAIVFNGRGFAGHMNLWVRPNDNYCGLEHSFFPANEVGFTEDGGVLTSDGKEVRTWVKEDEDWRCQDVLRLNGAEGYALVSKGYVVAFNDDGQKMITSSNDGKVQIWVRQEDGWCVEYEEQLCDVTMEEIYNKRTSSVAFSGCGQRAVAGCYDGMIMMWVFKDDGWHREAVPRGHTTQIESVTFSSCGGFLISVSENGTVRLWDIRLLKELSEVKKNLLFPHALLILCMEGARNDEKVLDFRNPKWAEWEDSYEGLHEVLKGSFNASVRRSNHWSDLTPGKALVLVIVGAAIYGGWYWT